MILNPLSLLVVGFGKFVRLEDEELGFCGHRADVSQEGRSILGLGRANRDRLAVSGRERLRVNGRHGFQGIRIGTTIRTR